jgi:hypothetical protein
MQMIAVLNGLVYVLHLFQPEFVLSLILIPGRILQGEVWRLVSYIFVPEILFRGGNPAIQPLLLFLYLWFLIWMGDALEHAWGAFRLTLFYLLGMLGVTIATFFFSGGGWFTFYLNLSLFFAFATLYPDVQIYLLLVIPVKMKWAALISLAGVLLGFIWGPVSEKAGIIVSFANYFVFFGPSGLAKLRNKTEAGIRRRKYESQTASGDEPLHRCANCGKTEKDDPYLDFRVAKDGEEYCVTHLPK